MFQMISFLFGPRASTLNGTQVKWYLNLTAASGRGFLARLLLPTTHLVCHSLVILHKENKLGRGKGPMSMVQLERCIPEHYRCG